ncbi:MAG: hypothetical protein QOG98_3617, partial [Pseudonocardiales bacterium]|nr:hypothetical protein [Pseudonocardiales bacterium]
QREGRREDDGTGTAVHSTLLDEVTLNR